MSIRVSNIAHSGPDPTLCCPSSFSLQSRCPTWSSTPTCLKRLNTTAPWFSPALLKAPRSPSHGSTAPRPSRMTARESRWKESVHVTFFPFLMLHNKKKLCISETLEWSLLSPFWICSYLYFLLWFAPQGDSSSTLTITNVLRSDLTGPIYCKASNALTNKSSTPFNLTVYCKYCNHTAAFLTSSAKPCGRNPPPIYQLAKSDAPKLN